jgi:anti-sigma regulatory factor (Ser/Thr protein kinase)
MTTTDHRSDSDHVHVRTFPGTTDQVCRLREYTRQHLPDHPDAPLVASEIGTNAIIHTRSGDPGGTFQVRITRRPDRTARLEIHDQGGPTAFGDTTDRDRDGGRGLFLINAFANSWGITGDHNGRTIWAEFTP